MIILISCKKNEPYVHYCKTHPEDCYMVQEVKEYFLFGLGSYWVYEEETSGLKDSSYVVEAVENPNNYYFSTKVYSEHSGYNYRYWPQLIGSSPDSGLVPNTDWSILVKMSKTFPGEFVSEKWIMRYKVKLGDSLSSLVHTPADCQGTYKYCTAIYPTYDLNGHTFTDVVKIEEECTASENYQSTVKYYSRFHGLIRKELLDSNQVWSLKNFELNQ